MHVPTQPILRAQVECLRHCICPIITHSCRALHMTPKKLAEVGCESLDREAPFKTNRGGGGSAESTTVNHMDEPGQVQISGSRGTLSRQGLSCPPPLCPADTEVHYRPQARYTSWQWANCVVDGTRRHQSRTRLLRRHGLVEAASLVAY